MAPPTVEGVEAEVLRHPNLGADHDGAVCPAVPSIQQIGTGNTTSREGLSLRPPRTHGTGSRGIAAGDEEKENQQGHRAEHSGKNTFHSRMRCNPLLLVSIPLFATQAVPPIPGVVNHWAGNSGGGQFQHIQNFIEDMVVKPDGTVLTQSFWDEAQHPDAAYKDGIPVGYNWEKDSTNPHPSRRASFGGVTWNIRNFWGRAFLGRVRPPPRDSLPFLESSDGRRIDQLVDPTAIAFDRQGRLLVAENGPDQNIKIFDVASVPRLVGTFGDSGGVFAGPVRGVTGPRRFWGIRGLGVDSSGRLYVGCTGMPMQVGGGTDIRCFSGSAPRDTLQWQILGLAFVNTLDADPDSGGSSLQKNATRFHMDWDKPPGASWSFAAVTVDPFRYPDDPRLVHSLESVWFRRIEGKRFLFQDDMYGNHVVVTRFEDHSEIGIPTLLLPVLNSYRDSGSGVWALDRRPVWGPDTTNDYRRWVWRDDNADGQVQSFEFREFRLIFPYTRTVDIDDAGDIWWTGGPYMVQFPTGGLDRNGVPRYDPDSLRLWDLPFKVRPENNGYVMYMRYLRSLDVMILATGVHENLLATVYRYDRWSERAKPFPGWGKRGADDTLQETWRITVPYKFPSDWSQSLDARVMDTCIFPNNLTADEDFLYVGYVDKGPDGRRNGEISVFDLRDGSRLGWIAPGPETNFLSGWFDLWHAINAYTMPTGEKLLMAEEDYSGHINVYKWCPANSCRNPSRPSPTGGGIGVRASAGALEIRAERDRPWAASLHDLRGRQIWNGRGTGPSRLPAPRLHGLCIATIESGGEIVRGRLAMP